ncbi:MAG: B12-binding domain-containing protein [Acidobacteriota bacterium]
MARILTPRDLAQALDVSESSVKRWVDEGRLAAGRTAGGHRRIALEEAVRFVRAAGLAVLRPERLGLRDALGALGHPERCQAGPALFEALRDGNAALARGLLQALYLAGLSVAQIVDGPLREAMARLGELWRHEARGVYVEHRATEIALDALRSVRAVLPPPAAEAAVAVGGAPEGDPYQLPSLAVAMTLHDLGWAAHNLGAGTPFAALAAAIEDLHPRLVWLSLSAVPDADRFALQLAGLLDADGFRDVVWAIGGRGAELAGPVRSRVLRCERLAELEAYARGLAAGQAAAYARPAMESPPRRSA